jgi:hypothetical protein
MKTQTWVWKVLERRRGAASSGVCRRRFIASLFEAVALVALPVRSIVDAQIPEPEETK